GDPRAQRSDRRAAPHHQRVLRRRREADEPGGVRHPAAARAHRPDAGRPPRGNRERRRGRRRAVGQGDPSGHRSPPMITILAAATPGATAAIDPLAAIPAVAPVAGAHGTLGAVGMVVVLTLVTLLPAIVLSCTCFVRFIVVLGFVRTGIGTPSAPPNQVVVGLALFMAAFVSAPVATEIYERAGRAYLAGQIDEKQAFEAAT